MGLEALLVGVEDVERVSDRGLRWRASNPNFDPALDLVIESTVGHPKTSIPHANMGRGRAVYVDSITPGQQAQADWLHVAGFTTLG